MIKFSGGCMCGAVRYEVSGDLVRMVNCHCDDCRKNTGASFATNVFFNTENVQVTEGKTRSFEHISDAGNRKIKEFCPTCGSQLFSSTIGRPLTSVKVGSIDDASFVKPTANLYCKRALSYSHLSDDLKNFEQMPT
jgi:hypothetical protein